MRSVPYAGLTTGQPPSSRQITLILGRPALDVWEKTEIFVYQTEDWGGLGRILIGDTEILTQIVSNDFSLSPLELQPPLQQFFTSSG